MADISYEKKIAIRKKYDVLVAGAGPAGICAAVAAARQGVKVALVERYGVLGGNLTVGFVGPILGMVGKGTMRDELVELLGVPENDMIGETGLHPTVQAGERQVNTTQVNGIDATDVTQIFRADLELRRQIEILTKFVRENLPGYENCRVVASGATTGVRETRRVMGEYVISAEEMAAGVRFEDVIVHDAEFVVDIHNPEGAGQAEEKIQYVKPYDLPYRCFIPRKIERLFVAGRCISGTHRAHASYRVMSICMAMGEAVGIAAALCAVQRCIPRDLDVKQLQSIMLEKGIQLYGLNGRSMKKAKNFETALHARRAVRTSAMPPAVCVHQNHTCALFPWAWGTSMTLNETDINPPADASGDKQSTRI